MLSQLPISYRVQCLLYTDQSNRDFYATEGISESHSDLSGPEHDQYVIA